MENETQMPAEARK
jgi:hypothetical protein